MGKDFSFCFKGGEFNPSYGKTPVVRKTFLFGIVGGKEQNLYSLVKSGIVLKKDVATPIDTFGIQQDDLSESWEQMPLPVYQTSIKYWKLFTGANLFGVRKRSHSIYTQLMDDVMIPVSSIIPVGDTDIHHNEIRMVYPTATKSISNQRFVGRFRVVDRNNLKDILGPEALQWARRVPVPSIPILKEMISTSDNSRQITNRVIRQRVRA